MVTEMQMKKVLLATFLFSTSSTYAAMTPAEGLKQAPEMVCTNHGNQDECRAALKAIMFGVYSFTALDEQCESSSESVKSKMDEEMKVQCAAAKSAVEYLKTLRR